MLGLGLARSRTSAVSKKTCPVCLCVHGVCVLCEWGMKDVTLAVHFLKAKPSTAREATTPFSLSSPRKNTMHAKTRNTPTQQTPPPQASLEKREDLDDESWKPLLRCPPHAPPAS